MARRSLSAQVIEEADRVKEILEGAKGLLDPMSAHMVETALQGLHRIESLCLSATQRAVDAALAPSASAIAAPEKPRRGAAAAAATAAATAPRRSRKASA